MNTLAFVCLLSIVFLIKNFKEHITYNIMSDYNENYEIYNINKMFIFHNLLENII
jgi:hypothetical protein